MVNVLRGKSVITYASVESGALMTKGVHRGSLGSV